MLDWKIERHIRLLVKTTFRDIRDDFKKMLMASNFFVDKLAYLNFYAHLMKFETPKVREKIFAKILRRSPHTTVKKGKGGRFFFEDVCPLLMPEEKRED